MMTDATTSDDEDGYQVSNGNSWQLSTLSQLRKNSEELFLNSWSKTFIYNQTEDNIKLIMCYFL